MGCLGCSKPPPAIPGSGGEPDLSPGDPGRHGHVEALEVRFDPGEVSYAELLEVFWRNVDPFDEGGQFCDRGSSYLSAIFVKDEAQRAAAEASRAAGLRPQAPGTLVTPIREAAPSMQRRTTTRTITGKIPGATSTTKTAVAGRPGYGSCGASPRGVFLGIMRPLGACQHLSPGAD